MPFLNPPDGWADALLVGLLAFALRSTLLLAAAWAATKILRNASAATRHLIWTSAIAGVLALPVLSATVPAWNVPVVSIAAKVDAPLEATNRAAAARQEASSVLAGTGVVELSEPTPTAPAAVETPRATPSLFDRIDGRSALAVGWLLLAVLMLARLAIANARVASWQRSSQPVQEGSWLAMLHRLTRQFGIERPVRLLENGETDVPVTWGTIYPVILLPAAADEWDEEQRAAVLTHELAHIKRFDALSQLLGQIALALLWFHPLVWVAVRRMRLEREHACDDFVLVAGARASRYADDLLGLARGLTRPTAPAAAALAMARRSELEGRLLAILDPGMKRTAVRRARVAVLTASVILFAMPLAAFRPAARVTGIASQEIHPALETHTTRVEEHTPAASDALAPGTTDPVLARQMPEVDTPRIGRLGSTTTQRLGQIAGPLALLQSRDTEPPPPVDIETLIAVARATKRMTSDYEKGQMLALVVKRYQPNDSLREAYIDAVASMTSDHERSKALAGLLDRDSLPPASTARVLRSALMMSSDAYRGQVLRRVSPVTFADTTVQRAYLDVITGMTSNMERAAAISSLVKQRPLTPGVQLGLIRAIAALTSNTEKANTLLLFASNQGIADEAVRRAFLRTAETLTSDSDYRRVIAAVVR